MFPMKPNTADSEFGSPKKSESSLPFGFVIPNRSPTNISLKTRNMATAYSTAIPRTDYSRSRRRSPAQSFRLLRDITNDGYDPALSLVAANQ